MNSLALLARQLDRRVRPPPAPRVPRVPTWAAFPAFRHRAPRRSASSPALLVPAAPPQPTPSLRASLLRLLFLVWSSLSHACSALLAHLSPPSSAPDQQRPCRTDTPSPPIRKPGIHQPKTLVLDLDETLIHSTSRPITAATAGGLFGLGSLTRRNPGAGHIVEVVLQGKSNLYHVYKRPFVDFFLRTVSGWYTLVIFTASMQEYADPVIDWLDAGRGILAQRFFRDSCTQLPNGSYTKDLSVVDSDLSRVCLVDNSPISYKVNEANGIPIEGWTHDPSDEALLDLLPVLDSLRFTSDVRRVLGLRTAGLYKPPTS
ncbi:hypothetical protein APHAL10511_001815 [Amanita phalloides]|nr:hypothetical protein APHAL10511_001815 [Amanita phalloides]